MPTYEYKCKDCESFVALERSMTDESVPLCTHCNSENLNRVWNVFLQSGKGSSNNNQKAPQPSPVKQGGCGSCNCH